jgi:transcriptional regulator with PAS, ATPase and Fis domain
MHAASPRRAGPFVALNCAAIPRELLESELFGHKKGAYTGATADRAGAFEEANGGTLFLDEVGECPLDMQAKLLRVLQPLSGKPASHRLFRRLGETRERESDVRLISATNQNLPQAIERRDFRSDLYYRLAVVTVPIPPLRERREDIPVLAAGLLQQINASFRLQEPAYTDKSISGGAKAFVAKHFWPGNVRQLFNTLVQAAVMAEGDVIERQDIVDAIGEVSGASSRDQHDRPLGDGFNLIKHLESIQREYLQQAMTEARGVKTHAAKLLGIENYQTLDAQLKRLKVNCRD